MSRHGCTDLIASLGPSPTGESEMKVGFVRREAITPHEDAAPNHEGDIASRIRDDRYLANPIIVEEVGAGEYALMDGTHRLAALEDLGCDFAFVQVVRLGDPASASVATWSHLVSGVSPDTLRAAVGATGLSLASCARKAVPAILSSGKAIAVLRFATESDAAVVVNGASHSRALRDVVDLYGEHQRVVESDDYRFIRDNSEVDTRQRYNSLLVSFAPVTPVEVHALIRARERIPSGISRVVLHGGRILGVKVGLHLLGPDANAIAQLAWLKRLRERTARWFPAGGIVLEPRERPYDDPLIVYDGQLVVLPHARCNGAGPTAEC